MKSVFSFLSASLMIFLISSLGFAQGQRGGPRQAPGGAGQMPPLLRIFDTDENGELSKTEIDNASQALRDLDKNKDGKLTLEEVRPTGGRGAQPQGLGGQSQGRGGQPQGRAGQGRGGQQQGRGGQGQAGNRGGRPGAGGQGGRSGGPPAGGRGGDPAQADAQFAKQVLELDENHDNLIAKNEIPAHMHAAFKLADADKNGSLDNKELLVLASQFRRNKLNPDGENTEMKNRPTNGNRPNNRPNER